MEIARKEQIAILEESIKTIESKKSAMIATYDNKIATVRAKIEKLNEQKVQKKTGRKPAKKAPYTSHKDSGTRKASAQIWNEH